ncbi:hypothetical protein GCM10010512_48250 [Streptomyces thermoviolaceus subsp. thermoviolaceus]|nr:hypothetical protein GCM10010512_48250 [Streptomyces thermoviolaceus subsp. thermoviolaceus]
MVAEINEIRGCGRKKLAKASIANVNLQVKVSTRVDPVVSSGSSPGVRSCSVCAPKPVRRRGVRRRSAVGGPAVPTPLLPGRIRPTPRLGGTRVFARVSGHG